MTDEANVRDKVDIAPEPSLPTDLRAGGYRARPSTPGDLAGVVAAHHAASMRVIGRVEDSVESIRADWAQPGFDQAAASRVVIEPGGRIVGYGELRHGLNPHVEYWARVRILPDQRGRGIAAALFRWIEGRGRLAARLAPSGKRVYLQTLCDERDTDTLAVLHNEGYEAVRVFWAMGIDLDSGIPAPAWPEGIAVRTMHDGERRAIYDALNDAFADHWEHHWEATDEALERWWYLMRHRPGFDSGLWFLAVDGEEIAGMALCYAEQTGMPDTGWISILGVRGAWRRKGIALALLRHSFRIMRVNGLAHAGLGVDAGSETGAIQLYETAGMRVTRKTTVLQKDLRAGT